jgi:ABC-type sulfate transport system substrate-binding protein
LRRTKQGQSGKWEYIDYEEVKHYVTRVDPLTGAAYRQLSHVTQEEKGKTVIEFEDEVVTAIEESEDRKGGNVRIVVPPVVFGW